MDLNKHYNLSIDFDQEAKYYNWLLDFDQEARFEKLSAPLIYEDIGRRWCCLNLMYWKQNAYI